VQSAGRGAFSMSAVVALVDTEARIVTFRGRRPPVSPSWSIRRHGRRARALPALADRARHPAWHRPAAGPLLGSEGDRPGDALVFYTASLTDARDEQGHTFGERRLQHILRRASLVGPVGPDGSDLADQVADEVAAHVGGRNLDEDILVATVHVL
jgi:hypothetical protein